MRLETTLADLEVRLTQAEEMITSAHKQIALLKETQAELYSHIAKLDRIVTQLTSDRI